MRIDPHKVSDLLRDAGRTIALPLFADPAAAGAKEKAPGDYVTEADHRIEHLVRRRLMDLLPGSTVMGEELAAADNTWAT
ncbi:MAG: hypothetical protein EXQ85_06605 [Alphaproteobacteria bacterium]|nr:hypothetical protein [Alphaproteobacteria bacterium]